MSWQPRWWLEPVSTPDPIRLPALVAIEGLAVHQGLLLGLDRGRGYLFQVVDGSSYRLLNPSLTPFLKETYALASNGTHLWFALGSQVVAVPWHQLPYVRQLGDHLRWKSPYPLESLAIAGNRLYASCYQREKILVFDAASGSLEAEWPAPGIGREQLCLQGDYLWVSDRVEETIFVLHRHTGEVLAALLSPLPGPTGLAFYRQQLWVGIATEEPFIRESPNDTNPFSVDFQDKTLIAPIRLHPPHPPCGDPDLVPRAISVACAVPYQPQTCGERAFYTLTQGYRVEMIYLEEMAPHEEVVLPNLIWQIALPCTSVRQRVVQVEPFGIPYKLVEVEGQQVAEFHLGTWQPGDGVVFGWRAILDLYSIKYHLTPADVEDVVIPKDLQRYLVDDDDLAMDHPLVKQAARLAVGTETNLLRKALNIRNYVYDQLRYRVTSRIQTPDIVLHNKEGSCGEYVGVLLALLRLNGIPCRTVGRYKCPLTPEMINIPASPQYNHVWIEFYVPGWGWLPMESNPDDLGDRPYPRRYFMGLPWTHAEIAKGIPFETCNHPDFSIGELAINHVQFRILHSL
ncbi:MAG: transglutaminase family protein [Thermostichales cyanobacterium BF4_bins_65]